MGLAGFKVDTQLVNTFKFRNLDRISGVSGL